MFAKNAVKRRENMGKKDLQEVVTIKDISEKLNVSISSVHRALQGKEGVSRKLKEKILQTAKEMGYVPNYVAASMKRKKRKIAVILPRDTATRRLYFDYIWNGVRSYGESITNFNLELEEYFVSDEKEQRGILENVANEGQEYYGGVLTYSFAKDEKVTLQIQRLVTMGIEVLVIDDNLEEAKGVIKISPSETYIGEIAGEFISLITPQTGTVLVTSGRKDSVTHIRKIESFCHILQKLKPQLDIQVIHEYSNLLGEKNSLYKAVSKVLQSNSEVVAIYGSTSYDNLPIIEALSQTENYQHIKIIGTDVNEETIKFLENNQMQAVIHQDAFTKGSRGLEILVNSIIKKEIGQDNYALPINIVLKSNLDFYRI